MGRGVSTLDRGGVPTLNGGGYLPWMGDGVPILHGEGYQPWMRVRGYLPWMG